MMIYLSIESDEEQQNHIRKLEQKKPTEWRIVAIACESDFNQAQLIGWSNSHWRTIHSWPKKLSVDECLEQTLADIHRNGEKSNLSKIRHRFDNDNYSLIIGQKLINDNGVSGLRTSVFDVKPGPDNEIIIRNEDCEYFPSEGGRND